MVGHHALHTSTMRSWPIIHIVLPQPATRLPYGLQLLYILIYALILGVILGVMQCDMA
jgi:hypothetical protein